MAKKMIINRKQFQKLSENEVTPKIVVPVDGNTVADAVSAINNPQTQRQLNSAQSSAGDVTLSLQGSGYDDAGPTQVVNKGPNDSYDTALGDQVNSDLFAKNPSIEVNDTVDESRRFTKKQLEEARLANMKKNGHTFTKKNLLESWDDEYVDIDALADFCDGNDFLYVIRYMGQWRLSCANSTPIQKEIISDIYKGYAEETREIDSFLRNVSGIRNKVDLDSVTVVKISGIPGQDDYYILWEQDF